MHTIKYRLSDERLHPRRTKLEIPGWAGKPEPRADGSHEYAWHCVPFSEAAQYGLEVFFPYDNELRVSTMNGHLVFDARLRSSRIHAFIPTQLAAFRSRCRRSCGIGGR
jgi:hypothetical protein